MLIFAVRFGVIVKVILTWHLDVGRQVEATVNGNDVSEIMAPPQRRSGGAAAAASYFRFITPHYAHLASRWAYYVL